VFGRVALDRAAPVEDQRDSLTREGARRLGRGDDGVGEIGLGRGEPADRPAEHRCATQNAERIERLAVEDVHFVRERRAHEQCWAPRERGGEATARIAARPGRAELDAPRRRFVDDPEARILRADGDGGSAR